MCVCWFAFYVVIYSYVVWVGALLIRISIGLMAHLCFKGVWTHPNNPCFIFYSEYLYFSLFLSTYTQMIIIMHFVTQVVVLNVHHYSYRRYHSSFDRRLDQSSPFRMRVASSYVRKIRGLRRAWRRNNRFRSWRILRTSHAVPWDYRGRCPIIWRAIRADRPRPFLWYR